jgi:hypothetical protein
MMWGFVESTDGAVTVDWVVLTAALVGLAVATANAVWIGAEDLSQGTATVLQSQVVTLGELGHSN